MFNQKGQAFSTFKLLIAAVVAIAMLTILLPIINQIGNIGQTNPIDEASRQIKSLYNSPGEHLKTKSVVFAGESSLNAKSIAERTGIVSQDQVCVSAGDFREEEDEFLETGEGKIVRRAPGKGNKTVALSILCDRGQSMEESISDYDLPTDWMESCSGVAGCANDSLQTCCIIAIRRT